MRRFHPVRLQVGEGAEGSGDDRGAGAVRHKKNKRQSTHSIHWIATDMSCRVQGEMPVHHVLL